MTRIFPRFFAIATALLLTACASMLGPRNVDVPLATLQASLERQFPFNSRYLEIFDIQLRTPQLSLQPGSNRVVTSFNASIAPAWLRRSWEGNFALSGVLALDPARNAVVLTDPRVETLNIDGLDPKYSRQIGIIGGLLAEQVFQGIPLYTFQPDQFRYAGTSFFPTKINTHSNGLVVTFEPVK